MKTIEIVKAYRIINEAKLTKMEDADKYKVIKAIRALKPIATSFDDFTKEAQERLKGEEFANMQKKAEQWQKEGEKTTLTMDERIAINRFFTDYNKRVEECVKEEAEKEVSPEYGRLSEEAFSKLIGSNDWSVKEILAVMDALK